MKSVAVFAGFNLVLVAAQLVAAGVFQVLVLAFAPYSVESGLIGIVIGILAVCCALVFLNGAYHIVRRK